LRNGAPESPSEKRSLPDSRAANYATNIQSFFDRRNKFSIFVENFDRVARLGFAVRVGGGFDFGDLLGA
jgi:hypothetical protein